MALPCIWMTQIVDILASGRTLSFEFFPPPDEDARLRLTATVEQLSSLAPSFVSVTCGAGGTGHDLTRDIVVEICRDRPFPAMAHLTCVGHTTSGISALLDDYAAAGVKNILALAGDPPDGSAISGDFLYASDLVKVIRAHPTNFSIGVAAHPEVHPRSADRKSDRRHLATKLDQADFAITQFFFEPTDYVRLCEELAALGCHKPIIPGIMPVTGPRSVRRYAAINGTAVPEELFDRLDALDPSDRMTAATDHAVELCEALLSSGAPGIHLYTLNRPEVSRRIASLITL